MLLDLACIELDDLERIELEGKRLQDEGDWRIITRIRFAGDAYISTSELSFAMLRIIGTSVQKISTCTDVPI